MQSLYEFKFVCQKKKWICLELIELWQILKHCCLKSFKLKCIHLLSTPKLDQLWYVPPEPELNIQKHISDLCLCMSSQPCYRFSCSMRFFQQLHTKNLSVCLSVCNILAISGLCTSQKSAQSLFPDIIHDGALLTFHSPFFFTFLITSFIISVKVKIEDNQQI